MKMRTPEELDEALSHMLRDTVEASTQEEADVIRMKFWSDVIDEATSYGFDMAKNLYNTSTNEDAYDRGWNDALDDATNLLDSEYNKFFDKLRK